jgi:IS30 family transposase
MVDALIKQDWSPEQISGRLYEEQGISISHEWIYLNIYKDKRHQIPNTLTWCAKASYKD